MEGGAWSLSLLYSRVQDDVVQSRDHKEHVKISLDLMNLQTEHSFV